MQSGEVPIISKKIKKNPFQKEKVEKIVGLGYPEPIPAASKYKKRFKIGIKFQDTSAKIRDKTVYFGSRDVAEFVDHKNQALKYRRLDLLRKCSTPFDSNYWVLHLLNGEKDNMLDNYRIVRKNMSID